MNIKELYIAAKNEFKDLIDVEKQDFRLEEAELNPKEGIWDLVISYLVENKNKNLFELTVKPFQTLHYDRIY
jgi:hypothetical protein